MFLILVMLIIVLVIKVKPYHNFNVKYMSIENTTNIKGIFILIVFIAHFNNYVVYSTNIDNISLQAFSLIGQRMVTLFMLYSGYGILESIKKKDYFYIKQMPKNRLFKVWIQFAVAVLIFVIADFCFNNFKTSFSIKKILLSLIGWDSVGNSNWYIFAILILYLITYIAFTITKKNNQVRIKVGTLCTLVLVIIYCVVLRYVTDKSSIWYDTTICYIIGMLWSIYKDRVDKLFNENKWVWWFVLILCLFIQPLNFKFSNIFLLRELALASFAVFVVVLTMKIEFGNNVLTFCGNYLFEIYILQRLPMIYLGKCEFIKNNVYLYFAACVVLTFVLAFAYKSMWKQIYKK